jgi:hypothetical protein
MPKPKLSFEALLAALAVVGCAKNEAAKAEPAPSQQIATAVPAALPPPPPPAVSVAPGVENKKPAASARAAKGNAACGAGACNDDMKK